MCCVCRIIAFTDIRGIYGALNYARGFIKVILLAYAASIINKFTIAGYSQNIRRSNGTRINGVVIISRGKIFARRSFRN